MSAVANTYRIRENFNFLITSHEENRKKLSDDQRSHLQLYFEENHIIFKTFPGKEKDENHFCLRLNRIESKDDLKDFRFETSYYVGAQWLVKDKLPLLVEPKFNESKEGGPEIEIDYIKLMVEALEPSENAQHLKDLVSIDFEQQQIEIEQQDDLLSPLLIIQYLHLLKGIVKKGLKNSYYRRTQNLKSRVRGKILVSNTVKKNHARNRMLQTICTFDEFGIDHNENRLLKKAFLFSINYLQKLKNTNSTFDEIEQITRYIKPAFQKVSDEVNMNDIKAFKPNPMFREYGEALKLAKLILKRFGFNITQTVEQKVKTPPFWIDMSKLFELHVLKSLRQKFPAHNEVLYQQKINGYYPDYLLKSQCGNIKMVIDAKYKNYNVNSLIIDDLRQVSGYARMEEVYRTLKQDNNEVIDCLIIYPNLESKRKNFSNIDFQNLNDKESKYRNIFKLDISLPQVKKN